MKVIQFAVAPIGILIVLCEDGKLYKLMDRTHDLEGHPLPDGELLHFWREIPTENIGADREGARK